MFSKLTKYYELLSENNLIYYMYIAYEMCGYNRYDRVPKGLKEHIKGCIFSNKIRKGLPNKKRYNTHHLLPKYLFPYGRYDLDNGIPLNYELHGYLHEEYTNHELLIDPIQPIINVLEESFLNSK